MQDHQIDIQLVHNNEWHWGGAPGSSDWHMLGLFCGKTIDIIVHIFGEQI